jgi:anti-anti-sigma factor
VGSSGPIGRASAARSTRIGGEGATTGFEITEASPGRFVLRGELDMAARGVVDAALAPAIAMGRPIRLDLTEVSFLDSTGLQALVGASLAIRGGCIELRGVSGSVGRVLEVAGVADLPSVRVLDD